MDHDLNNLDISVPLRERAVQEEPYHPVQLSPGEHLRKSRVMRTQPPPPRKNIIHTMQMQQVLQSVSSDLWACF